MMSRPPHGAGKQTHFSPPFYRRMMGAQPVQAVSFLPMAWRTLLCFLLIFLFTGEAVMDYGYEKRNISDLEYRLRLLMCVNELGVVTREQLWPFVAKLEMMDYMPMCLHLEQLLESHSLAEGEGVLKGTLFITETGAAQLMMFMGKIASSDQSRIRTEAPKYMAGLREARTARSGYESTSRGYGAKLTLMEGDIPNLICLLRSDDKRFVETVVRRFRQNAPTITLRLLSLCSPGGSVAKAVREEQGSDMETILRSTAPGRPCLSWAGGAAYAGNVCLEEGETQLRFSLQLGSRENALRWIYAMENGGEGFVTELKKILVGFGL